MLIPQELQLSRNDLVSIKKNRNRLVLHKDGPYSHILLKSAYSREEIYSFISGTARRAS